MYPLSQESALPLALNDESREIGMARSSSTYEEISTDMREV